MALVYRHRRNDTNEVFYIGIGSDKRPYDITKRNRHWNSLVKKYGYTVEILISNITHKTACELEIGLIAYYGRRDLGNGSLVNMTNGGIGAESGELNVAKRLDVREKLRVSSSNLKHTNETKQKLSEINKGKRLSNQTKLNISNGLIGHNASKGRVNPKSVEFIITHPNGVVEHIKGLRAFCRLHNLNRRQMRLVAQDKKDNYKQWKCEYKDSTYKQTSV